MKLKTIYQGQANKESTLNMNSATVDHVAFGCYDPLTTGGLTFGFTGGNTVNKSGVSQELPDGTIALNANSTNYIEYDLDTNTIKNSSSFTTGRVKLYEVVTDSISITSITKRKGENLQLTNVAPPGADNTLENLVDVQVSSPTSGQSLVYQAGKWVNQTVSGGGGSGGSNAGSSVIRGNSFKNANGNADWSHYTVVCKLDSSKIINSCNSFKVKLLINSNTTQCKIGAITIKKTLPNSTSVIGSSSLTINNSSSPVLTLTAGSDNYFITDECGFSIDLDHDYYIFVYFINDAVNTQLNLKQGAPDGDLNAEYASGDLTSATTISQNTFGYALLFKQVVIVS